APHEPPAGASEHPSPCAAPHLVATVCCAANGERCGSRAGSSRLPVPRRPLTHGTEMRAAAADAQTLDLIPTADAFLSPAPVDEQRPGAVPGLDVVIDIAGVEARPAHGQRIAHHR